MDPRPRAQVRAWAAFLSTSADGWILCAEFNRTPAQLRAAGVLGLLGGAQVVVRNDITSTSRAAGGRLYDFVLCRSRARSAIKYPRWVTSGPWSASAAPRLGLHAAPALLRGPQLGPPMLFSSVRASCGCA